MGESWSLKLRCRRRRAAPLSGVSGCHGAGPKRPPLSFSTDTTLLGVTCVSEPTILNGRDPVRIRRVTCGSLLPQQLHRVQTRGPFGWQVTGDECNHYEHARNEREGGWIRR